MAFDIADLAPVIHAPGGVLAVGKDLRVAGVPVSRPVSYQWLAGGKPIAGATGPGLRLAAAQAGTAVSVIATVDGQARTSAAVKIAKVTPAVTASAKSVGAGVRPTVTVKISGKSVTRPTGKVTVTWTNGAAKGSKSVTLRAFAKGKVSVKLPTLAKGTYAVTAKYAGNGAISAKSAKKAQLTVK
jgi:hypothetical protein